jgi:hypothetical protein
MDSGIRPGTHVLVRWAGLPHVSPCHLYPVRELPLFQSVGIVDRIDGRYGEHCVMVVFRGIPVPPFGTAWCDVFTPDASKRLCIPTSSKRPTRR